MKAEGSTTLDIRGIKRSSLSENSEEEKYEALRIKGKTSWSMELKLRDGIKDETMALLFGMSLEDYRDMKRWVSERAYLGRLTGDVWSNQ